MKLKFIFFFFSLIFTRQAIKIVHDVKAVEVIEKLRDPDPIITPPLFLSLQNQCFSFDSGQYTYDFCPFNRVTQRSKTEGTTFVLGWEELESNPMMKFTDGYKCGENNPRSAIVEFHCGVENIILSVEEPEMCHYTLKFNTPIVCETVNKAKRKLKLLKEIDELQSRLSDLEEELYLLDRNLTETNSSYTLSV